MCAINGITKHDVPLVERMNAALLHRGPDGSQVYAKGGITLGHNRLAIIDLSEAALQPMHSPDGRYSIVFNGEIYNYRELREELASLYAFKTQSDTEVLLAAYIVWGETMFSRLRGIFAFGIWDAQEESLLLARDHMGVKPLYYTVSGTVLSFSSEIPALLTSIAQPALNTASAGFYLAMEYVPGPETLVRGISKLQPGHSLRFKNGAYTVQSFIEAIPVKRTVSHTELYETIDAAVKRQVISDRPIGAYLSGGFDSSIVVHHMTKYSPHTKTYSVNFETVEGQADDSIKFNCDADLAKKTAAFYGTDHHEYTITLPDVRSTIEKALGSANEPVANATLITQYLLSDFVRKDGVVVVLGGDGGDELFGGYTRHRIAMGAYLYQQLPTVLQRLGASISPRVGKLSTPFFTPLHRALMVKDEKKIAPILNQTLSINAAVANYFDDRYAPHRGDGRNPLDVFMQVDRETWLPDECFIRSDYASMAHGVELRVPFVDTDVVRLSDEISVWKKTSPRVGKRVIRGTYRPYLPAHLYREPKRGWLSPAAKWFRDPVIHDIAKNVFSSGYYSGLDSLFNWDAIQTMFDAHVEKRGYYLYPLWNIMALQIWARKHNVLSE